MTTITRKMTNLFASTLLGCTALIGCGEDVVNPNLDQISHVSAALSSASTLRQVNGTYTSCLNRSGIWKIGVGGYSTTDLSVIKHDPNCVLAMTSMVVGDAETPDTLSPDSPIVFDSSAFAAAGVALKKSPTDPIALYLNSDISDLTFSGDFTLSLLYSDDPRLASPQNKGSAFSVKDGAVSASNVDPPDYALAVSGISIQVDAVNIVQSTSGNASLSLNTTAGQKYVVTATALGSSPSFADIDAAYLAGTSHTVASSGDTSIASSLFTLDGEDLSNNDIVRSVIVENTQSGTTSYQWFQVTFQHP